MKPRAKVRKAPPPPLIPRRKWLFRLAALLVMPFLALVILEMGLRLAGCGYPTGLFEKVRLQGRDYLLDNEKFTLRFFPPELARWMTPLMFEAVKPANTYRIFVFGESAAQGDPEPSFGAQRYLEVLLRKRYPGVNFEVINVAITAISSHVIVPIARDCAKADGDLWIIYMGNNEMIGPFGAATVFGAKAPPWPVVRLGLALQDTRVGQLLVNLGRKLTGNAARPRSWGGLDMFTANQLAPEDPRKDVVYKNFQRNLQDIIRAGRQGGAAMILNTVAVNLKDCAPFASLHSSRLAAPDRDKCDRLCAEGRDAEMSNDWKLAESDFAEAVALDPQLAEAQFHEGRCLLQLNDAVGAAGHFQKARDCDALPFRADSRINGIIRDTARKSAGPDLVLCDAAASLPEAGKIPGEETFYEHVHFNFDGNYRLAMLWAAQAGRLLPSDIKAKARGRWATQEVCEARLGLTDWNRFNVFYEVWRHMGQPPFDSQSDNARRMSELAADLKSIARRRDATAAADALAIYTNAIARAPRDYILRQNYGKFLEQRGNLQQALLEWKQALELSPHDVDAIFAEGRLYGELGDLSSSRECLRQVLDHRPRYAKGWLELGKLAAKEDKLDEALEDYRRSAVIQPEDAEIFVCMGEALSRLKRPDGSLQNFRHAVELDGAAWQTHYALGGELGLLGRMAEAKVEFQQVVRLQPQNAMGHLYLGIALLNLHDPESARREFSETLRLDPANKPARRYLAAAN